MDYRQSGVNIDAGNEAVERIKPLVKRTFTPNVLGGLGGFAGAFELPKGYDEPVLISCTDGVGTKVKLAQTSGLLDTVGIDLVAMCVNDMICCGATPLYFLDYVACHALCPDEMEALISGMVEGCLQADCALIGGEMAEMNDLYRPGDFDLAGFSVGVVEKSKMIDGSAVKAGHKVYGLRSSGAHSNGFSLLRKVITPEVMAAEGLDWAQLLTPTRIYVKAVLALLGQYKIDALAHITGGGLVENVERVLPAGLSLLVDWSLVKVPEIFSVVSRVGNVAEDEMRRVFNMGVGMVLITADDIPETEDLFYLGRVDSV